MRDDLLEAVPLSLLHEGDSCRILGFRHDTEVVNRLHQLGLARGEVLTVIAGSSGANYLVAVGANRVALEHDLVDTITVQKLHPEGMGAMSSRPKRHRWRARNGRGR